MGVLGSCCAAVCFLCLRGFLRSLPRSAWKICEGRSDKNATFPPAAKPTLVLTNPNSCNRTFYKTTFIFEIKPYDIFSKSKSYVNNHLEVWFYLVAKRNFLCMDSFRGFRPFWAGFVLFVRCEDCSLPARWPRTRQHITLPSYHLLSPHIPQIISKCPVDLCLPRTSLVATLLSSFLFSCSSSHSPSSKCICLYFSTPRPHYTCSPIFLIQNFLLYLSNRYAPTLGSSPRLTILGGFISSLLFFFAVVVSFAFVSLIYPHFIKEINTLNFPSHAPPLPLSHPQPHTPHHIPPNTYPTNASNLHRSKTLDTFNS